MTQQFARMGATLARQDYDWLLIENEDLVHDIEAAVSEGADPETIGRYVARQVGDHRVGIIRRCTNAARHIASVQSRRGG